MRLQFEFHTCNIKESSELLYMLNCSLCSCTYNPATGLFKYDIETDDPMTLAKVFKDFSILCETLVTPEIAV